MENPCGVLELPAAAEEGMGAGICGNGLGQGIVEQDGVVDIPQGESHDPPVTHVQNCARVEFPHRGARIVAELRHIVSHFSLGLST